jgi:hypothetical protein
VCTWWLADADEIAVLFEALVGDFLAVLTK